MLHHVTHLVIDIAKDQDDNQLGGHDLRSTIASTPLERI
jgi:hypothetical protein